MGVMNNVTALISRASLAMRAGLQFGGARDLYKVFGYKTILRHDDFVAKYVRQDIAQRIINAPVDATWTDPPMLKVGKAKNKKEWEEWKTFTKDADVYSHLRKADIFAGLGMFSILVIGFDDGRKLDKPVNAGRRNKVIYMQPYLEGSVAITKFEEDETNPRFGKPIEYEVTPGELLSARTSATTRLQLRNKFTVHYTRVLHLADGTLENTILGHSRLEPVYNVLDDLLKVAGGSAETYWLTANRGMQVDVDKDMELAPEDAADLSDEIDEYQHQLRRVIRTRGVKISNLGSDVADPKNEFGVLLSLLSATTSIPQRVLMGAEAGQLASQQDRANWAVAVAQRVANYAEPHVLKPFIALMAAANVFDMPEGLEILWPEPFKMNPLERAQTSAQMARSAVNVARALEVQQKIKTNLMSIEESREIIAPGDKMPIFAGLPTGAFPPPIEEVDPQKFVTQPTGDDTDSTTSTGPAQRAAPGNGGEDSDRQPDPDTKRPEETRDRSG